MSGFGGDGGASIAAAASMTVPRYRLGVDVGGTHTDLVLLDVTTGALLVEKVASTPGNPAIGVLDGVANFVRRGIDPAERSISSPTAPRSRPMRSWKCAAPRSGC